MTRLNPEQTQTMKEELTVELADWLMETYNYSPQEALDALYTSETFDRLQDNRIWLLLPERRLRFLISEKMK